MRKRVLQIELNSVDYAEATTRVVGWANRNESRYVCVANVHVLMEAYDTPAFANIVNNADLVTPDGMPLVWMMRMKGVKGQERVYGPKLMLRVLEAAAQEGIHVGFYGSKPRVLDSLAKQLQLQYPKLSVAYSHSPPFRELSPEEDASIVSRINESGARILFVGLGCPKQEIWMAQHRGRVKAVMLGVGAAFDFLARAKPQAPAWLQHIGLEWLFRFSTEPRRLWKRYLFHNPRFVALAVADLLGFFKT